MPSMRMSMLRSFRLAAAGPVRSKKGRSSSASRAALALGLPSPLALGLSSDLAPVLLPALGRARNGSLRPPGHCTVISEHEQAASSRERAVDRQEKEENWHPQQ
eukprot:6189772-Pleurochrysis_carterae.AAC.1